MKIRVCVLRIVAMLAMITGQGIAVAGPKGLDNDVELIRLAAPALAKPSSKAIIADHDVEGIAVFEISGDYGRSNTQARADVARRYFERYQDDHDLLLVFSDFEFDTGEAAAFANIIKNDTQGLGLPAFDSTAAFGSSSGRMHNYIDMAALSRWEFNPSSPRYGITLDVAAHEVMHRWVAHPKFMREGQPSDDLLGRDLAHWSFFLDSDASIMYGSDWRQGTDGQFEAIDIRHRLSPLDLYLAGFFAAAEVPTMTLIRGGQGATAQDVPLLGFRTPGTAESVSIAQIIAANGARQPDVTQSGKRLSAGLVLLLRPGQPLNDRAIFDLQRFALDFETRFAAMTRGRASLSIRNQPLQTAIVGAPTSVSVPGGTLCSGTGCLLDVAQAKVWLLSKQRLSDGAFVDKDLNSVPTSAAALRAMYSAGFGSTTEAPLARNWLVAFVSRHFDDLAWKGMALVGITNPTAADAELANEREPLLAAGMLGLGPSWSTSAWDMAAVLSTSFSGRSASERDAYLGRIRALQNADGGFGISPGGVSHVGLTAWVLNEVAPLDGPAAQQIADASAAWLLTQRSADGGFGAGADGVLPTAWAVAGLVRLGSGIDVTPSIAFLRAQQGSLGDWNGSVFTTAEVIRVLGQIAKPNLSFDAAIVATPVTPISGDLVQLRSRVRNDGVVAENVLLSWFRGDPDQGGTALGAATELGSLGAGQSIEVALSWDSSGLTGVQQLVAVLDRANAIDELNENDNRQSLTLDVGALPLVPDAALLRENFTLTPSAVTVFPASMSISGTLANVGGAALTNVPLVVYSVRNSTRTELARVVLNVAAQATTPMQLNFTLQRTDPLSLALVADPDNTIAEIRESNNELLYALSSSAGIDLAISAADIVQLSQPAVAGQSVRFRVTAHNHGASASPTFALVPQIRQGAQTYPLGNINLQLDAGASAEREVVWTSASMGTAALEVALDPQSAINDADRSNNSASLPFEVVDPSAPNLIVIAGSVQMLPSPLDQSRPATLQARVRNAGAALSGDYVVAVSTGGETGARTELARITVNGGLAAGAEVPISLPIAALTTAGDRYFFVSVDPDGVIAELNDNDNTAFMRARVRSLPDASVTVSSVQLTPSNPAPGAQVIVNVTVRNLGEQPLVGLQVRLFDGTPSAGTMLSPEQIAPDIAGGATTVLTWNWTVSSGSDPTISAELDPNNQIAEGREDNNLAVLRLQAIGNEYATEPYISPNDDGIKESTQVVFRQLASAPAVIDVRDVGERIVRTFTTEEFIGSSGWAVLWDGRNNAGQVVYDGRYRVQASTAVGTVLAEVAVVVDTNRSSLLEAMGTGLEKYTELVHGTNPIFPPIGYPDQDAVLLQNPLNLVTPDPLDRLLGLYRFDVLLQTLDPVLDANWILSQGSNPSIKAIHWTASGEFLVLVLVANNQDTIWRVRVAGHNVTQRLAGPSQPREQYTLHSSDPAHVLVWSDMPPNPMARRYRLDTGAQTILQAAGTSGSIAHLFGDGFIVGYSNSSLAFVFYDPAKPARIVLAQQEPGYIAHLGAQGVLVHRIVGSQEAMEWRSLRSAESQVLIEESLTEDMLLRNRCWLGHEDSGWIGGHFLLHNARLRNVALLSADTGLVREIAIPLVNRVGGYIAEHDPPNSEYQPHAVLLGVERTQYCAAGTSSNEVQTTEKSTDLTRRKSYSAGRDLFGREPILSLVHDTELVRALIDDSWESYIDGARSIFGLNRATGEVTHIGSDSSWPMVDPRDQTMFSDDISALIAQFGLEMPMVNPFFSLSDGSGVVLPANLGDISGYEVFIPGGYLTGAVLPYAPNRPVVWPTEQHLFGSSPNTGFKRLFYSTLANQTTKLRVRGSTTGIDLLGIASDKNFQQFELAWANPATPDQWNAIGAAIEEPAIDGEFMSWTPPAAGQYLLRLSTEDKAGNVRQATARALSPAGADIADVRVESRYVSPNGDGVKDELRLSLNVLRPTTLRFEIRDGQGVLLRTQEEQVSVLGRFDWNWDGRLLSGQVARDGGYRVSVGTWFATGFTIDTTPPTLDLLREPARLRLSNGKVARVVGPNVSTWLAWNTAEANPLAMNLQRGDGAAPTTWVTVVGAVPAQGQRVLSKDDAGNYQLVAEDRAGNRAVSAVTGLLPDDLALVGRWTGQGQNSVPWGCATVGCAYSSTKYVGDLPYPIESGNDIALDLYLAPGTPSANLSLRYRVDVFGTSVTAGGAWQPLAIASNSRNATELRLNAVAPTLPLGSQITLQAATQLTDGSAIFSEPTVFEYTGISPPRPYFMDQRCTPARVDSGLTVSSLGASWVCVEEALLGAPVEPTLTVIGLDGSVRTQAPVKLIDGVVLFELPDPNCRELIAHAKSSTGRSYVSRTLCGGAEISLLDFTRVAPVVQESCDAPPLHMMSFAAGFIPLNSARVARVRADFALQDGTRRVVLDLVDPPAVNAGCAASPACLRDLGLAGEFDASGLPDGQYEMSFEATLSAGSPVRVPRIFYIDRTPAAMDIRVPREGRRECARHTYPDDFSITAHFPVDAVAEDASGVSTQLRFAPIPPATWPFQWYAPLPQDWELFGTSPAIDTQALRRTAIASRGESAVNYPNSFPLPVPPGGVQGLGEISGPLQMQFAAVNWGGAPQCRVVNFYSDISVELGANFAVGSVLTRDHFPLAVINPIGATGSRAVEIRLRADEPVLVRIQLLRGETAQTAIVVTELSPTTAYAEGVHSISWNGTDGSGAAVADGAYWLRILASDDCGHEQVIDRGVIVDTTGPVVLFQIPEVGATIESLLVRIEGETEDASGGSYALSAESATSIQVGNGSIDRSNEPYPAFAHTWNRGEISGPVILRVTATDLVGNSSVTELPIQLAPRPSHLFDDAEAVPELYSPNADGQFDRMEIRYALAANVDVTVSVLRNDGSLMTVLQNADPKLAGNHALQWSGQGLPIAAADGRYRVELRAVNALDPLQVEVIVLPVTVDVLSPQVTVVTPDGNYSNGTGLLKVNLDEPHFGSASWQLGTQQGVLANAGVATLLDLAQVEEGPHALILNAGDRVANVTRLERELIVDRTAPIALIATPEEGAVLGGAATQTAIEGTASDRNLDRFILSIAQAQTPAVETNLVESTTAVSAALLHTLSLARPDGEYLLKLRVEDKADHNSEAERRIHIDHTTPVAMLSEPVDNAYVPRRFRVSGSASDLHLADYRLRIATPDQASLGLWSDILIQHASVTAAELGVVDLVVPDGDYFLELVARDKVQLSASTRIRIHLDATAPIAPIELVAHRQGDSDVALAWIDTPAPDFAGYQVYRDGAKLNTVLIPGRSHLDAAVPNGTLRYEVTAIDHAGNESARSNAAVVVIDRTPPDVDLIAPADQSTVYGLVDVLGTAFSESDFDRYRLSLLDANTQALVSVLAESRASVRAASLANWDTRARAEGASFRLLLEAWDENGNRAEDSIELTIDNLPPATPTGLIAVDSNGDGQINWDANVEPDLLGYVLIRDGNAVNGGSTFPEDMRVLALATNNYLDPGLSDGVHTWFVFAIDRAGNLSPPSAPADLNISRRPPDIRIAQPVQDYRFDESVRVLATTDDTDIAQVWFDVRAVGASSWTPLGAAVTQRPYAADWTPGAVPFGDYEIRAQARDNGGLEDATPAMVRVRYTDLEPPQQVLGLTAYADGGDVQLSWNSLSVPDLAKYRVERSTYSSGGYTQVIEVPAGTNTLLDIGRSDGVYYYRVSAIDAVGNVGTASVIDAARVFTITVDAPFSPIRLLSTALTGATPNAGTLNVMRDVSGTPLSLLAEQIEQGRFTLPAVPLIAGENHLLLRLTDAEQNISRIAETWVTSSTDPAAPTGLAVAVNNHDVSATWNANAETDIAGYRLFRRDFPVLVERDLESLSAVGTPDDESAAAIDGNPNTAWLANRYFSNEQLTGVWLELTSAEPSLVTGVSLTWMEARKPLSFDVMAYSGRAWIRVASVSDVLAQQSLRFDAPYRTTKLRIVPTASISGYSIALAEVAVSERPLIAATSFVDNVIDGSYPYTVSAVNELGFEGPRSAPAIADVGDATPPDPVVLSGQLQERDAQLSWTPSASIDTARYRLLRDGTPRADINAPQTTYVDTNLANGSYIYTVIALDAFDNASAPSNAVPLTVTLQGPGIPENLRVTALARGAALDVSWQQGAGAPTVRYGVRRSVAQTGPFALLLETPTLNTLDEPLVNGTRYWYTVEAFDAAGNASGQTAPMSGVPQDQQAPLSPSLTFPVQGGETIDLETANSIVAGASEAGSRVDVRRSGAAITQTDANTTDQFHQIAGGFVDGKLRAAPSGSWFFGDNSQQAFDSEQGNQTSRNQFGQMVGWTRDNRIVHRDGSGVWLSSALTGTDDRTLTLPLTSVATARFSSDLRYALALGENLVSGSPIRAIWLIDRSAITARRVLTIDADSVDFASVVFSEFAGYAAWRSQAGDLLHLRLGTAQARPVATAIEPARIELSSRDGEALHVRVLASEATVHRVNADGVSRVVGPGLMAAWSPDASQYVVVESGGMLAIRRATDDALLRRLNLQVAEVVDLDWTMSGRLLVHTSAGMRSVDPTGYFRSTPITLQPGENRLELYAVDAGGQGQSSIQPGVVRVPNSQTPLADLSLRADDIRFLPAAGGPGQSYSAQVTVRNIGSGGAASSATRATLVRPDGSQIVLSAAPTVPSLGAGSSATMGITLGQLSEAGNYWLNVELLVTAADANPANHVASQRLIVSAGAAPVLELSADSMSFAPGIDATGLVSVRNIGNAWSGSVRMRIATPGGDTVTHLPPMLVNALAFGAEVSQAWRWPTANVLAGGYRVHADLLDEQNRLIATRIVDFAIAVVRDLRLDVTSDRDTYLLGDTVRLNATLDYRSGNAVLAAAVLRLRVADASGIEVFSSTRSLATMLPGYRIQIPGTWIASGSAGLHSIRAELLEAGSLSVLAQGSFLVTAQNGAFTVSGSIDPVPAPLIAGRPGLIDYALANPSSASVAVDQLRLRLLNAAGSQEISTHTISGTAAALSGLSAALNLGNTNLAIGDYLAVLDWRATASSVPVTLATRSVSVVDGIAPQIVLRAPEANAWVRRNAPLVAQVTDAHSGVDRTEISVDGGSWRSAPAQGQGLFGGDAGGLSDGTHRFQIRARDRAGNESISEERSFQVDNAAPVITITGVSDGDVVAIPVTPIITIDEANPSTSTIVLNTVSFVSATTISADGNYLLSAVAHDLAGNVTAASVRFQIDTVAPALAFVTPLDGDETTLASIEVRLQTEPGASVRLTAGVYVATVVADASGLATFTAVPLVFGINPLSAIATDLADNQSAPVSVQVTRRDNSGAALVGSLIPTAPVFPLGTPALLNWQVVNPAATVAIAQSLRIRAVHVASAQVLGDDAVSIDVPANGQAAGVSTFATAAASLGRYIATLSVMVGVDSVQLATAEFDVLDSEPPLLSLITPAQAALVNTPVRVLATATDRLGTIANVRYRLDGAAPISMTPAVGMPDNFESAALDLADADYQVQVTAEDNAGNTAMSPMHAFSVDRTPPQIQISDVADGGAYNVAVVPLIQITDLHPDTQSITLDGLPFVSGTSIQADGAHALLVTATDAAGNSASRSVNFRIDRTAPVIAFSYPAEGAIVATPQINVGGLTEAMVRVEFRIGAVDSTVFADDLGGFIVPGVTLQEGANMLQARAIDALGNASAWISRTVEYRPNAGASLTAALTLSTVDLPLGDVLTATYALSNTGAVNIQALPMRVLWVRVADQQRLTDHRFSLDLAPTASTSGSVGLLSANTMPGAHVVVLEGLLTAANGSQSWQALATEQAIVRDVLAPTVMLLAPAAGTYVDTGFTLRVTASDVHSTVTSVQGLVAASPVAMTPGTTAGEYIAVVNATSEGPLLLSARAIDSAGNAADAIARQVIVDLLPPVIIIDGVIEGALVNQPVTLQIQLSDVSPLQSTVTLDGQTFVSGNTVVNDGPHLLRVTATDALGRSSEALRSFTIDRTPPLVQINLPNNGAIIFADSTRVVGATEALASVTLNVGNFNRTVLADGNGIFSVDNVPLAPGQNQIAARATDRAGNAGVEVVISVERRGQPVVALQGNIGITAVEWPNGTPLSANFVLDNIGSADLVALPVRIEARRRDSQQVLQSADFTFDLSAGAQRTQSFQWVTNNWGLGTVDITLTANLPEQRALVSLDTQALLLVDREAPAVQFELPVANAQMQAGDAILVLATDRLSTIASAELRIDNGGWVALAGVDLLAGRYGSTLPILSFGAHQLSTRTRDAAGNMATTQPLPITVGGVLPLNVTAPINNSSTDATDLDFVGTTSPGALVRVRRDNVEWLAQANLGGSFTVSDVPLIGGANVFTVRAEDGLGNASATILITVIATGVIEWVPVPAGNGLGWLLLIVMILIIRMSAAKRFNATVAAAPTRLGTTPERAL